ncbi:uncharacterized protein LOC132718994 [Ruditapes philippinarum]|uniref:uncharacterized protein LOC132718994 n=1 Tax=Ruditapes philippinarum TaxID=129788 RepID=UPI00295BBF13|nr:uncharacterized protein LOC132718994 [Ruditapes philippinarum]
METRQPEDHVSTFQPIHPAGITNESQTPSTGEDVLQNISPIEHDSTLDNPISTEEFETWIENISRTPHDLDQENIDSAESDRIGDNVSANENTSILVDIPDLNLGDTAENPSILETSLISENRNQIEFGNDEFSPMKCPIFRTELGGATVTECGLCMCSHCFSQRKDDLDELCNVCGKSISSHHIVEMEKASENILRSHYLTIEQLEDTEHVLTQDVRKQQEEIEQEQSQNQRLQAALFDTEQDVCRLNAENEQLQIFQYLCFTQASELQNYREYIVPSKDKTIEELQTEVATLKGHLHEKHVETEQLMNHIGTLDDEIATLRRLTVSISELEVSSEGKLGRAIQQLQHFYDRDYRSRHDITDKMDVLLQTRLETVLSELSQQQAVGDQLASVIMTYTSMVQENANLHRGMRTKQDKIQDLQVELRHTKARNVSP